MPANLSDAFKAAKKDRKVLSKHIIWESGVSKTQFYRIINGQEAPSSETREKISHSLGIDGEQFDSLHQLSKKTRGSSDEGRGNKDKWFMPFLALSIFSACFITLMMSISFNSKSQNLDPVVQHGDSTLSSKT